MVKKLVIISIDAFGSENLTKYPEAIPTILNLIKNGAIVNEIKEIYPSLTYPSHTSIVTGVKPNIHGIVNNTKIQPERPSPDWYWYHKDIKVETLYDKAKKKGLKTAAFLWPVTANSSIDYNIAEIFPNRIWTNQVLISLKASSPFFLLEMNHKYGHLRHGIEQPYLDNFITACAIDTIKTKKPDLTMIHLVDLDSMYHRYGVHSEEAYHALMRQDLRVKNILAAIEEAGMTNETNIAILGDHYQLNVDTLIRLNKLFEQKGWLTLNQKGKIKKNWQVLAKSCDGSCYIYLKPTASDLFRQVKKELENIEGIEKIYEPIDILNEGADPNAVFMLEAKKGYYFIDEAVGELLEETALHELGQPERYLAVHGYHPSKSNYATTLILNGPDIKKGVHLPTANLVDEAPTFARLLDLPPFDSSIEGQCLNDIFV